MNRKRLLIIEKPDDLSGLTPKADCEVFLTYEPQQALSLLMGGGTLLKRNKYGEEKIRPHLLLMHVSFIAGDGVEFLELIQKYYSLKHIRVFIFGAAEHEISEELRKRLNVSGYLPTPLDLEYLSSEAEKAAGDSQPLIKKMFAFPAAILEEHVRPFFAKVGSQKAAIYTGGKVAAKAKLLCSGVTVAVASVVGVPLISAEEQIIEEQPVAVEQKLYIRPAEETAVAPKPEEPPVMEESSMAKPFRKKTTVVVTSEQNAAVDSASLVKAPEPITFKIQVIEDTSEIYSESH